MDADSRPVPVTPVAAGADALTTAGPPRRTVCRDQDRAGAGVAFLVGRAVAADAAMEEIGPAESDGMAELVGDDVRVGATRACLFDGRGRAGVA